jgi:hypothetical protein
MKMIVSMLSCMEKKMRNSIKILFVKSGRRLLGHFGIEGRIILNVIVRK